jgi:hypothetical protein
MIVCVEQLNQTSLLGNLSAEHVMLCGQVLWKVTFRVQTQQ